MGEDEEGEAGDPPRVMTQDKRVLAYYRPFPWDRIGRARTGRTGVERCIREFASSRRLHVQQMLVETDRNVRRTLEERVVGSQLMQILRDLGAHGIMVCRWEHIFSSATEAIHSIERWIDEGFAVYCVQPERDKAGALPPGGLPCDAAAMIRSLAALQRITDLERMRQQFRRPLAEERSRGRLPFGFQLVNGRLVEEPDRMERIVRMKTAHRRGKSYRQIAQAHGVSVATAYRLVQTDLRRLRRLGARSGPDETADSEKAS